MPKAGDRLDQTGKKERKSNGSAASANGKRQIRHLRTGSLIAYERNARTHSEAQIAQLMGSLREFGWTNPVLVDESGLIIAGHARVEAAKRLGMETVPCIELAGLSDAQKKAYIIADNRLPLNAGWNDETLRLELADLKGLDFDLGLTGFDSAEILDLLEGADVTFKEYTESAGRSRTSRATDSRPSG